MLISLKIENTSQPSPLEITLLVAIVQDTYEDLKQLIKKYGYFTDGPYRLSGGRLVISISTCAALRCTLEVPL